MVKGEFVDILESFSEKLNFSVRQCKRIEGVLGGFDNVTGTVYTLGHCDLQGNFDPSERMLDS